MFKLIRFLLGLIIFFFGMAMFLEGMDRLRTEQSLSMNGIADMGLGKPP